MSQGSLDPKIRFLCQKVCSVARVQTHRQTDTKVNTEDTHSGFQEFLLQPIIKDRSIYAKYAISDLQVQCRPRSEYHNRQFHVTINLVCFFPTETMEMIKIHFGHYVGKYGSWYWICPNLLCRDRSAAAQGSACFSMILVGPLCNVFYKIKMRWH